MADTKAKAAKLARRRRRVRAKVRGTAERPRLCVSRTNANIYAQLIDDDSGATIAAASSIEDAAESGKAGSNIEAARAVGTAIGERAKEAGLTSVVFDRNGNLYHGRVKAVAEGAREAGLEF